MVWEREQVGESVLYRGDVLEVLPSLPAESLDAIITDPPYGLEFMGKEWDGADGFRRSLNGADTGRDNVFGRTSKYSPEYRAGQLFQAWCEAWARECLRVLKPGGHLVAFGGSRTYHRLACAIEDAGFEIRDQIMWLYGSGFPKNLDVSKALDDAAGAERVVVAPAPYARGKATQSYNETRRVSYDYAPRPLTVPTTDAAKQWDGWGTALKPAHEPIVLARKPLIRTVAENVLMHGVGALNIAASRIPGLAPHHNYGRTSGQRSFVGPSAEPSVTPPAGRWPANVVHDGSPEVLDVFAQYGDRSSARANGNPNNPVHQDVPSQLLSWGGKRTTHDFRDSGSAARFFYTAKASPSERSEGLPQGGSNTHPTVKPLDLMRYLVQLVAPPGGRVLDPFMGSGTTGCACAALGLVFLGIERDPAYFAIAHRRIAEASRQLLLFPSAPHRAEAEEERSVS
jgi:DNA modification methylase